MDLMGSFRVLRSRWILSSTLLLLAILGTAAAAVVLPWSYQSVGTTVLLNSKSASVATDGNPLLAFDPSLSSAAEVLSLAVTAPSTVLALKARGYSATYQVTVSSVTGGPILQVTATGKNKTSVENTLHGVMNEINNQLLSLQSGVASRGLIRALPLSAATQPSRSISKKAKPVVAVLGLGLVLTFAIPQLVDALANRGRAEDDNEVPQERIGRYRGGLALSGQGNRYLNSSVSTQSRPRRKGDERSSRLSSN